MENTIKDQILEAEENLRYAMIHSDLVALNELLAPELLFTNHLGAACKQAARYRSPRFGNDENK